MGNQNVQQQQGQCFTCIGHQQMERNVKVIFIQNGEWRKILKLECEELKQKCLWANAILKQIKKINKSPCHIYYQQLQSVSAEFRIFQTKSSKSVSYTNNLNSLNLFQNEQTPVKNLLKQTDILEEALPRNRNNSVNPYQSGGSKTSSYIYLEKLDQNRFITLETDNSELLQSQLNYYIQISTILKNQLQKNDHQLNFVLNIFASSYIKLYNEERNKKDVGKCLFDIQQFSRIYQECIENYYDYQQLINQTGKVSDLLNKDNMLAQIVGFIFEIDLIYEITYDIILDYLRIDVETLRQKMIVFADADCLQFEINPKYRLDESTHEYLLNHFPDVQSIFKPVNAYEQCIRIMSNLKTKYSPQSKFKAIIHCQQKILKSIQAFYSYHQCLFDGQIDSDDLLAIQMYIVAKSQVFELPVHLYMIEQLATNKMIHGATGYYLISLQAAIKMILQLNN